MSDVLLHSLRLGNASIVKVSVFPASWKRGSTSVKKPGCDCAAEVSCQVYLVRIVKGLYGMTVEKDLGFSCNNLPTFRQTRVLDCCWDHSTHVDRLSTQIWRSHFHLKKKMRWFEVHTSPTTDWQELPAEASIVLWNCYLLNWIIASYLLPSFPLSFTPRRGSAFRGLTFLIKEQSVGWRLRVNDDPVSVRSRCLWRATFSLLHRKMRPIRQDLSIVWGFLDEGKQNETKWVMWVLSEKVASLWNICTFCQKGLMELVCLLDLSF